MSAFGNSDSRDWARPPGAARRSWGAVLLALACAPVGMVALADWPMLHGNAAHDGFVASELAPPVRLAWVCEFTGERLGTAMEPIVAGGRVFVATHAGNLYALSAETGAPVWRFAAQGPFLHSPACAGELVLAASVDGHLYAVEARTGELLWRIDGGHGGFSASPVVGNGTACIGARNGQFLAVDVATGKLRWRQELPAPIRQTAAFAGDRVFVTAEDLRVRCFAASDGRLLWQSEPLAGQTARDYYPIVLAAGGRRFVIVRTNPAIPMATRIARDRVLLCRNAGVEDRDWRTLDAWTRSDAARGTPALWAKEQQAIRTYLEGEPDAPSFFVFDAETGAPADAAPVLWIAGCQGVGAPPARTADGRLLVFYRSAYGNWNQGVAPLVTLGLLDLPTAVVTPLFHRNGNQPPWNTFWGTADESQNFVVAGHTALIVHQGTLSGFDLRSSNLFRIHGERDTFGGLRNPPWARNEWHGPARGGVALDGSRLFWLTGSRLLCLAEGVPGAPPPPVAIRAAAVPTRSAVPAAAPPAPTQLRRWLADGVEEFLSQSWAPLWVEPGLAGRSFAFADSGEAFEALAWAYPHLPESLQARVRAWLEREAAAHFPCSRAAAYSLNAGARREWVRVPAEELSRLAQDRPVHPFGNLYALTLAAERVGATNLLRARWPEVKASLEDFLKTGWRLDAAKGDLYANRYLAACLACERWAKRLDEPAVAEMAGAKGEEILTALVAWWRRAAADGTLTRFNGVGELDPFLGQGDAVSLRLAPHRHALGLFHGWTPGVAERVRARAPDAVDEVWRVFRTLYATWWLAGEERQVHSGENFVDPPELAAGAFRALAWGQAATAEALVARVDLPSGRADLYYLTGLALSLEIRQQANRK